MTIDIHTPHEGLEETVVQHAKRVLIRLVQQYKTIIRLECVMRQDQLIKSPENKVCEIKLSVYGENLFMHSRTNQYKSAVEESIQHMRSQLELLASRQNDLPDNITSTVKV